MYSLILENAAGNRLTFNQIGSPFTITDIDGLNPPSAQINVNDLALIDGSKYNSAKLEARTINLAFAIEYEAEKNRIAVYKVLKSKQYIKLYYKSQYRNVFIEGYISDINIEYFNMKQVVTVSILCPDPYLRTAQEVIQDLSATIGLFHFPFYSPVTPEIVFGYIDPTVSVVVENNGDFECGLIFTLTASDTVSDPTIFDYQTGEYIGIEFTFQAGDVVTIDTRKGYKTVTLLRGGVTSNIFNTLISGITWLQLSLNGSVYVYSVGSGTNADLQVTIQHYDLFEGV